jgi:hypothetical protein
MPRRNPTDTRVRHIVQHGGARNYFANQTGDHTVKTIKISGAARLVLYQTMHQLRPRDMAETRGLNRVFRELDLEPVEALARAGKDLAEIEKADDVEREVSEACAIYLRVQFDRLREVFPAGDTGAGKVTEGLPVAWARILAPFLDQLDAAYPETPKAA